MGLLILFFLISIIFSFLCSIWEAVLLSIPPSTTQIMSKKGTWVGKRLKTFKMNIDRPLAAILTLNTIAHTVGAIGVGAQAAKLWPANYWDLGVFKISFEAIIAALMTLGILILSEIIPKTLGANYWKRMTPFTVYGVHFITVLLTPLVWLSQLITKSIKKKQIKSVFSKADFSAIAEIGAKEGVIERDEFRILKNLLRFDKIVTKDIMTPRTVVVASQQDKTLSDFYNEFPDLHLSRIPVYKKDIDEVSGFVLKDNLLSNIIKGKGDLSLSNISRPILFVKDDATLPEIFNTLMEKKEHIAMVVDEYGGVQGLVTMEDILETLLGLEIVDELDTIADMQIMAREQWEKRAKKMGLVEKKG